MTDSIALENRVNTLPVKIVLLLIGTLTVMSGATIAPSLMTGAVILLLKQK